MTHKQMKLFFFFFKSLLAVINLTDLHTQMCLLYWSYASLHFTVQNKGKFSITQGAASHYPAFPACLPFGLSLETPHMWDAYSYLLFRKKSASNYISKGNILLMLTAHILMLTHADDSTIQKAQNTILRRLMSINIEAKKKKRLHL